MLYGILSDDFQFLSINAVPCMIRVNQTDVIGDSHFALPAYQVTLTRPDRKNCSVSELLASRVYIVHVFAVRFRGIINIKLQIRACLNDVKHE